VELGRYDEAVSAAQRMIDLRPDQPSYTRVSYLRELHGDLPGAVAAMRQAIDSGAPDSEATAWSEYQLGNLLFATGDLAGAEQAYTNSTRRVDGYVFGISGLGKVAAARSDLVAAAALYQRAVQLMPLPEFAAALGDLYTRLGDADRASEQYELVTAMQRLLAANGVRVDVDLALFDADHDLDLDGALEAAQSEYLIRPSVHVADALAWIEYRRGDLDAAAVHSREALRLGSHDPLMLYRAGVIAQAHGDPGRGRDLLQRSSELNPNFSIRWAPDLAARVATLTAGGGA
jgi:tetratricopeptide (TPR) repeat protein